MTSSLACKHARHDSRVHDVMFDGRLVPSLVDATGRATHRWDDFRLEARTNDDDDDDDGDDDDDDDDANARDVTFIAM